ncbi:MAG TPA: hypothetical protein VHC44_07360 [Verrucomicrobiae bacterium]|nr:hypothetical protein [Verrucomicrobiae bacterium]
MKTLKIAVLAVAAMVAAIQAQAGVQTNVVQNLSVQLFGVSQGNAFSFGGTSGTNVNNVIVGTRQVIQALGTATGNSFSFSSRLVVVTPIDGGSSQIQVRDGSNAPVDVSHFFSMQELSGSVDGSVTTTRPARSTSVSYLVARFVLADADGQTLPLHFDVNGFTTINSTSGGFFGSQGPTTDANVSGSGDRNGNLIILQGSVDIFGRTLEVVTTGPIIS